MKDKYYVVAKSITRWKLDNWFENWLGYRADKSEFWKRLYVLYYRLFDNTYYKNGLPYVQKEIEKQYPNLTQIQLGGGKSLSKRWLRIDMIYSLHRFGINFTEYFVHKYYSLNSVGREQINNLRLQYGFCEIVNAPSLRELFENKGLTYEKFKPFYKRDLITVNSIEDYDLFEKFLAIHSEFIYKPLKGVCGKGIKIYRDVRFDHKILFDDFLMHGPFVIEELIKQGDSMAMLHPESINTLRLATFRIKDDVVIYGAAVRMGTGTSIVDNAGSGGIYCHVNCEYGFIDTYARDYVSNKYVFHPDTGVRFIGFDIPQWEEAKQLVKDMAKAVDGVTVISWDLAYSINGWCMVEANDVGEPNLIQGNGEFHKYTLHNLIDKYYNIQNN
ncbi:MAG: hypothetical protein IKV18_02755 [Alistipes sp.]|nr:hypothetical protein [Alistipes sp.]